MPCESFLAMMVSGVRGLQRFIAKIGVPAGRSLLLLAPFLCSCADVRIYPVCLYDTDLGASNQAKSDWPKLQAQLTTTLQMVVNSRNASVIVTSRAAAARTNYGMNETLSRIWPAIACYGQSNGSAHSLEICESYIRAYLAAQTNHETLSDQVIRPPCQTLPGDPDLRAMTAWAAAKSQ